MPDSDKSASLPEVFCDLLVRLRKARILSQAGLVERILALIKADFRFGELASIEWLQEIEDGSRTRRVSRKLVNLLARALQCNDAEHHDLLVTMFPTYVFGDYVALLRSRRKLSRTKLARRLDRLDSVGALAGEAVSDRWLQNIEEGRRVRVSRAIVDLLARALKCDSSETFKLLMTAGLNPLADSKGRVSPRSEFFLRMVYDLEKESREGQLQSMILGARVEKFANMTLREIFIVFERGGTLIEQNDADEDKPPA
jgi:transcriptional regulator with XRE-family HTH domain